MKDLTVGNPFKEIFYFSIPILLGSAFQQLYNVVDSIVVGKFIGTTALAAVGVSFPLIFVVVSLFIGIGVGTTVIISQYFGAKQYFEIRRTNDTMMVLILLISLCISIPGVLFSNHILQFIGVPEEVFADANSYLQIYFGCIFFQFLFAGVNAVIRGLGDSKTPMLFLIVATLLNIVLDILFVVGFGWGVPGVAVATILAQVVALVIMMIMLNGRYPQFFDFSIRRYAFDSTLFKKILRIGFPVGIQTSFVALGGLVIITIVNPFGKDAVAAYSVAMRLDSFATLPAMNFATALSTFVGQNIGANKYSRVKQGLNATMKITIMFSITLSLILYFGADLLMSLFTTDETVIRMGASVLHIMAPFYIIFSIMFTFQGCLRGAGAVIVPMFCTFISLWMIRIPLSWYLGDHFGLEGIWWGAPFAWLAGAVLIIAYYMSGKWRKIKVIDNQDEKIGKAGEIPATMKSIK